MLYSKVYQVYIRITYPNLTYLNLYKLYIFFQWKQTQNLFFLIIKKY